MRRRVLYRVGAASAVLMICVGAAMVTGGVAWSASATRVHPGAGHRHPTSRPTAVRPASTRPILRFDSASQTVQLIIPTPACAVAQPDCQWMLFMNEPREPNHAAVGLVTGRSGTLSLPYPDFCGYIQIDALVGPSPWTRVGGEVHPIFNCQSPPTTTSTSTSTSPAPGRGTGRSSTSTTPGRR